ncbi:hypothetical protein [[Clostridium] scindens]|uniref:hypothetical protein n=1 Tax=Clostridium scindens (strain JCM 10418 / VPI 12708) TaxID=29347 RepID=UPI003AEFF151
MRVVAGIRFGPGVACCNLHADGEHCEKIQYFPESYLEITKEELENGEFGL